MAEVGKHTYHGEISETNSNKYQAMKRSVWPSSEGDFQIQCASLSEQQSGVSWSLQTTLHYTTSSSFTYSTWVFLSRCYLFHFPETFSFNDILSLHACRLARYRVELVRLRIPTTPWSSNSTLNYLAIAVPLKASSSAQLHFRSVVYHTAALRDARLIWRAFDYPR